MRKGICPKCGSSEIYQSFIPNEGGGIGWGDNTYIRVKAKWGSSGTGGWESFLCANCGYYENYIIDREILEMVKKPENRWVKLII
jgi:predicted nucleic-acid-binding Zn-ribbon protein